MRFNDSIFLYYYDLFFVLNDSNTWELAFELANNKSLKIYNFINCFNLHVSTSKKSKVRKMDIAITINDMRE